MTGFDDGPVEQARLDAAQTEWERNRRVINAQCAGIRQSMLDMEHMLNRVDMDRADDRDMRRHIENVRACVDEMDGENWLKSPRAMAELRRQEGRQGV